MFLLSELIRFLKERNYLVKDVTIDKDTEINRFASLAHPTPDALCWAKKPLPVELVPEAAVLVCLPEQEHNTERNTVMLHVKEPRRVFGDIVSRFNPETHEIGISDKTIVSPTAKIGENVYIGPGTVIGDDCEIGDGTIIDANVTIYRKVTIGKNCHISSGAVIGADGHGYVLDENNRYQKIRHMGNVVIGDNVDIGANSCVDRGVLDDTTIGDNTKIDNLVQIAHNVVIGENCMITEGSMLCGSCRIGNDCYLAPGSIIKNGVALATETRVDMNATVFVSNEAPNITLFGTPARPTMPYYIVGDKSDSASSNNTFAENDFPIAKMQNSTIIHLVEDILDKTIDLEQGDISLSSIDLLRIIMALDEQDITISIDESSMIHSLFDLLKVISTKEAGK